MRTEKPAGRNANDSPADAVRLVLQGRQELLPLQKGAGNAGRVRGMLQGQDVLKDRGPWDDRPEGGKMPARTSREGSTVGDVESEDAREDGGAAGEGPAAEATHGEEGGRVTRQAAVAAKRKMEKYCA